MEWISIYKTDPIPNKEYLVEGSGRYYIAECNSGTWYELEEYKKSQELYSTHAKSSQNAQSFFNEANFTF